MHFNRYVSTTSGIGYLWEVYRAEGLVAVFLRLLHALQLRISYVAYSLFPRKKFFMYKGSALNYISNSYNQSSWNERSIEIPLMHYYLEPYLQKKSVNILEIGAV